MSCTEDGTGGTPLVTATVTDGSLTLALVRAVAAVEDKTPESLRPLGEVIDPEALETVTESEGDVRVTFAYVGYRVAVDGETVEVYPQTGH